jgi:hydantoinase/carbamoylase family amidase
MPINPTRLQSDLDIISRLTHTPGAGASRPTFSTAWRAACDYVVKQAEGAGCKVRVDAAGNTHIRPAAVGWDAKVWMSGSHVDSVPHGGDFDGVVGVVAPLEVLRAAHEDGHADLPLELVIFAEEEGTTFGLGMLGSRTWAGTLDADTLATIRNDAGQNYFEAGQPHGVDRSQLELQRLRLNAYHGLIELHIEQGPAMWNRDQRVALVTHINGRRQYLVTLRGTANHAGSTSMADRRDALVGAAAVIQELEKLATHLSPQAVATVGRIRCEPNAVNVIAERVEFTIDFRAPHDATLADGDAQIHRMIADFAARRDLEHMLEQTEALPAVEMSTEVCEALRSAAKALGMPPLVETVSGALHDSAILAPLVPTAMLFVASRDGISHNPAEFSRLEDIAAATSVLYQAVAGTPA